MLSDKLPTGGRGSKKVHPGQPEPPPTVSSIPPSLTRLFCLASAE